MSVDEIADRIIACSRWERNWTESSPDEYVASALENESINPGCLPEDRLGALVEDGHLDEEALPEEIREAVEDDEAVEEEEEAPESPSEEGETGD